MAENIFEKVLENVDIVDVVSSFVKLEPKGKNFFGLCPFHDDSNPSMSVSREKQIFFCFVCKKGGNAIKFVEEYKHISSIEACRYLANEYHIDVSEFNNVSKNPNEKYYDAMKVSEKFYAFLMNDENYSKEARDYLLDRGINDKVIKEFDIGLSSSDNNALSKTLIDKGFLLPDLVINGLSNGDKDTFIDRVIVPIRDEQGRPIAFGGRIYKKGSTQAKYLNSKETPIFKKGETIFNIDKAALALKNTNYLIINEGYMDVIQSYANGIRNVIALMGTSLTKEQADLIKKYTSNVILCLDGDNPGIKAVMSVYNMLEEKGFNTAIIILPEGLDPDEYLRKYGKDKYLNELSKHRLDKIGYIYELTKIEFGELSTFNIESFKNTIFEKIKGEKSRSILEIYLRRLSSDLGVSFESINQDYISYMSLFDPSYNKAQSKDISNFKTVGAYEKAEEMIIDYSLKSYDYFKEIITRMDTRLFLKKKEYRKLFIEIGDIYDNNPKIETSDLILELKKRGAFGDFLYNDKIEFSFVDLYDNIIKTIKNEDIKDEIKILKMELLKTSPSSDDGIRLQQKIQNLKKELKNNG